MALISCPECGHRVSTAAPACPSCGYPVAGGVPHAGDGPFDGRTVGKFATVLGAWLVIPHIARMVGIVVFCMLAAFVGYFLFRGS
ncbi:zinc ribbon domain-containing protein [uncultured Xylophilus sp.]|uniref:zinc ribbon domain-containing protein n=1 Tax=uncultured Xylophilus sp. TaxID=296832 RepID=UPI0025F1C38A|nr:zinc ribbon domain-containing protein [uncultured Xylophilus sp.]